MDAFGIEEGTCGPGIARYANGIVTLPDGAVRGVEEIVRLESRDGDVSGVARTGRKTSEVAGSVRAALRASKPLSLPLRLALSTVRAGLGVIEEGLQPAADGTVEIAFADGTTIQAVMPERVAALIRRDAEIARGAIGRAEQRQAGALPIPNAGETAADEALTSIFRYEKRNGRLRRVSGKPED